MAITDNYTLKDNTNKDGKIFSHLPVSLNLFNEVQVTQIQKNFNKSQVQSFFDKQLINNKFCIFSIHGDMVGFAIVPLKEDSSKLFSYSELFTEVANTIIGDFLTNLDIKLYILSFLNPPYIVDFDSKNSSKVNKKHSLTTNIVNQKLKECHFLNLAQYKLEFDNNVENINIIFCLDQKNLVNN